VRSAAERFGGRFQVRDTVIQTESDYKKEAFNGHIEMIGNSDPVEQELFIRYDDRLVTYDFGELDEVSLVYAVRGTSFPVTKAMPPATNVGSGTRVSVRRRSGFVQSRQVSWNVLDVLRRTEWSGATASED
jgi:hypothetical protein